MPPITDDQLADQYRRAVAEWPWIGAVERAHRLPPMLLFALGSRETNLRNVTGDGGHGHGIWQRDDRSWTIPRSVAWYLEHPRQQAEDAAALLVSLRSQLHDPGWGLAVAAYNAGAAAVRGALGRGVRPDHVTTGGDYSADVERRRLAFIRIAEGGVVGTMLSAHFAKGEFACRHCGKLPPGGVSRDLLKALETARARHYPGGLPIASGYRCPQHRLSQASPRSRHVRGDAADVPPVMTVDQAKACGFRGIGFNRSGLVVHVDMRPTLLGRAVTFPDAGTA